MCTILVLNRVHPTYPVVVAANRDEFYDRPATGPQILAESPRVVGGLDRRSGGTWMGATETGLFVGLTNQRTYAPSDDSLRSRGEVVREVLRAGSVAAAERHLESIEPAAYNPFNLVVGNAETMKVAYARRDRQRIEVHEVPEGVHVLPNDRLDASSFPKVARLRARIGPAATAAWPDLVRSLQEALADHALPGQGEFEPPPPGSAIPGPLVRLLHAVCVHTPTYGTRSATIIALSAAGVAHYLFADGAPCQASFRRLGLLGLQHSPPTV